MPNNRCGNGVLRTYEQNKVWQDMPKMVIANGMSEDKVYFHNMDSSVVFLVRTPTEKNLKIPKAIQHKYVHATTAISRIINIMT